MPKFGGINERRNQLHEVIRLSGLNIVIDDTDHPPLIIKVASIPAAHMQVYFIDNDDYFVRKGISKDAATGEDFPDNDERMIFFIRGVMETVKKLRWAPDIIHCHGWMTSVVPLYVKQLIRTIHSLKFKIVTSLYNEGFESPFSDKFGNNVLIDGVAKKDVKQVAGKSITCNELLKFALDYSDAAIQGSPELPAELWLMLNRRCSISLAINRQRIGWMPTMHFTMRF